VTCAAPQQLRPGDDRAWARRAGLGLETAGTELAAAAAVLGDNQDLKDEHAALSAVAVGIANAGRAMLEVSLEEDWSCTGQMLSGAAGHLAAAGAAVKPTAVADMELALTTAADALDDAGLAIETEGCGCGGDGGVAGAWRHLARTGAAMRVAAGALDEAAAGMAATATRNSPSTAVARHLAAACEGLTAAGLGLGLTEAL